MTIRSELLNILVCPATREPLSLAISSLLARLNGQIAGRSLKNKAGQTLEKPLDGGLVRADQKVLYPIVDEIPMMLVDESILLEAEG